MREHAPVFIVAGETSGDRLAAGLIDAIRQQRPGVRFVGIGGPLMAQAGCELIGSSEQLSVMGLVEVIKHLPALFRLKKHARSQALFHGCRVFIGVDAPEFNLNLARQLHQDGLTCIQYVSPQVWAWRSQRVFAMQKYLAHVLCLLPFEAAFYARAHLPATFVGHPLADRLPLEVDQAAARQRLGLSSSTAPVVALLPGSRQAEVSRLCAVFLQSVLLVRQRVGEIQVLIPIANQAVRPIIEACVSQLPAALSVKLFDGHSAEVLSAADVVLVASGTATLETLLCKRPMVVAYKAAPVTAWLLKHLGLMKAAFFSQPNLLANARVVEEWFQEQVTPARLAEGLTAWLEAPQQRQALVTQFTQIHQSLRRNASAEAARVVLAVLDAAG